MTKSHNGSSRRPGKCHACGEKGHYTRESEDRKSDSPTKKVVLKETIGLITCEDPVRRGWYLASRCTVHVCNLRDMFVNYLPLTNHEVILEDNNTHVEVAGIGSVVLKFSTGKVLTLINVFHMPTMVTSLVSVTKLAKIGFCVSFGAEECTIESSQGIIGNGYKEDGLYRLEIMEDHQGENRKSDTPTVKVVLNETISLLTDEDPSLTKIRRRGWYLATRCTVHVCNSKDMFSNYQPLTNHEVILEHTDSPVEVAGIGSVVLRFTTGKVLTLSNVFHIPKIIKCLVSVPKLANLHYKMIFCSEGCSIEKSTEIVGKGCIEDGLYRLSIIEEERPKVVLKETVGLITFNEDPVLTNIRRRGWYLASRCTVHVCNSRDMFGDYQPLSCHEVILDNNSRVDVVGIGTVVLKFTTGNVLTLLNVFHMPAIVKCLVSVSKLAKLGFFMSFGADDCTIKKSQEIIGNGYQENGLYRLEIMKDRPGEIKTSDTPTVKMVLNETISLITDEDPNLTKIRRRGWYLATRCTVHVCNSIDMFSNYQPLSNHEVILEHTNSPVKVAGIGSVLLRFTTGKVLNLSNVFHIPKIIKCLISVPKLADLDYEMIFCSELCIIGKNQEILGEGYTEDGLFRLSIIEEERPKLVFRETISLITFNEDPVLTNIRRRGWYLASRCSVHVCNSRDMFANYQPLSCHEVIMENDSRVDVVGIGTVVLRFTTGKVLTLTNVFHIPTMRKCLVSIGKLVDSGFSVSFGEEIVIENLKSHGVVGKGYLEDGLFRLDLVEEVTGGI